MSSFAAKGGHRRNKEGSKGGGKIVSAAARILLEFTLPLLNDDLRLCLSPSGGTRRKVNNTVAENDATRFAARESNRKASFELNNVKWFNRGSSRRGACIHVLCAARQRKKAQGLTGNRRQLELLGHIPLAEAEQRYYASLKMQDVAA